jgi:hypothetical protein
VGEGAKRTRGLPGMMSSVTSETASGLGCGGEITTGRRVPMPDGRVPMKNAHLSAGGGVTEWEGFEPSIGLYNPITV